MILSMPPQADLPDDTAPTELYSYVVTFSLPFYFDHQSNIYQICMNGYPHTFIINKIIEKIVIMKEHPLNPYIP